MELPKYKCHKEVRAAKISWIGRLDEKHEIHLDVDGEDVLVVVTAAWFDKHEPRAGGYLVRYADGYQSYSPADAFEDGYSRVLPPPPPPAPEPAPVAKPSKRKGEV